MLTDEALILEFQRGSHHAFEELFERYRGPLYGFFRRRLAASERAEDLTQETFLVVLRRSARYEPRALFRTYLYGIALKLLAAERRKEAKDNRALGEILGGQVTEILSSGLWMREALAKLEPVEREIVMLREYEQLSYAEIAELLRIPLNTVRSRLFRSRLALKRYLEPQAENAAQQR